MTLSAEQNRILAIVERSASILSILGVATIIGTFCLSRQFRNPIHRIIFINAFYNIFDVLATFISLSGPEAGNHSHLCQFQGFLMQSFPLTDVYWTFAMAFDVFLIVFYKYEAEDLRKLEIKYIGIISALAFIPAIVFLFIHTAEKGPMYGSVILWCSISPHWVVFRIVFYYGPIWFTIAVAMLLYCLVGVEILKQRHHFRHIGNDYITLDTIVSAKDVTSNNSDIGVAVTSNVMIQSPPVLISRLPDEKEAGLSSLSESGSHRRPNVLAQTPRRRSPVSFRQYILMPLMFFVVLLAVWVAPTVNRVKALINPNYASYPLYLAVGSMGSLRGFWNGVVFITLGMKERKRQKVLKGADH